MENTNVVNDTPQAVVEPVNTDTSEHSGTEEATAEKGTKAETADRKQTKSENRSFAEMRRAKEASEASLSSLITGLNNMGFDGDNPDTILEQIEAKNRNVTVEQLRADKQAQAEAVKNDPQYKAMEQQLIQKRMAEDLATIQQIDPSVQSLEELGEDFAKLIAAGVTAKVAFNAISESNRAVSKPASPGPIGQSDNKEADFFTSEQLDALTKEDLANEKIFKKAMASLHKL